MIGPFSPTDSAPANSALPDGALADDAAVLGIESSCDETGAAVVLVDGTILSNVVASQDSFHAHFGGVVPEIASRRHAEVITAVVEEAVAGCGLGHGGLSLVAVTHGPGLVGSLVVGVAAAKAYAYAWGLPIVAVNHVEAHLQAAFLHEPSAEPPAREKYPTLCLVVSGGHTDLILSRGPGEYELLGCTRDDAAGEALDKVARLLGLGFPGGPAVERRARGGRADAVPLPQPSVPGHDFSFAGLKSALARLVEARVAEVGEARGEAGGGEAGAEGGTGMTAREVADFAAAFQEEVVQTLWRTTAAALEETSPRQIVVAGGVAANGRLREVFAEGAARAGVRLAMPPIRLCTDNAAMVALCGASVFRATGPSPEDFDVFSALPSPGG